MQSTRYEILDKLKRKGTGTIEELAESLGLTQTCVRQHMALLERDNLSTASEARAKLGRPHRVYRLTRKGEDFFPKGYDLLANGLLDEVAALDGKERVKALCESLGHRLATQHLHEVSSPSLETRMAEISNLLNNQGALAEWEPVNGAYQLAIHNCRFHRVAESHNEVCGG